MHQRDGVQEGRHRVVQVGAQACAGADVDHGEAAAAPERAANRPERACRVGQVVDHVEGEDDVERSLPRGACPHQRGPIFHAVIDVGDALGTCAFAGNFDRRGIHIEACDRGLGEGLCDQPCSDTFAASQVKHPCCAALQLGCDGPIVERGNHLADQSPLVLLVGHPAHPGSERSVVGRSDAATRLGCIADLREGTLREQRDLLEVEAHAVEDALPVRWQRVGEGAALALRQHGDVTRDEHGERLLHVPQRKAGTPGQRRCRRGLRPKRGEQPCAAGHADGGRGCLRVQDAGEALAKGESRHEALQRHGGV
mmetsp:Transcript_41819/g.116641  ORF Transcript_41819/g.116641 Transcript_41819/m.116641 type:complete len:311 (+) Transcript_41819:249-1181(+)